MRYFESRTPMVKVFASGGEVVKWTTSDGRIGWCATDRPGTLKTLEACIQRGVGGAIREGTREEYEAFEKKVWGLPLFRMEREYVSPAGITPTQTRAVPSPSPSARADVAAEGEPEAPTNPVPVVAAPEPVLRKRGRPRRAEAVPA